MGKKMEKRVKPKVLLGRHTLSGVDFSNRSIKQWGNYYRDCQVINFLLDGKIYSAIEDPCDGYRSMLDRLLILEDIEIANSFTSIEVLGSWREDRGGKKNKIVDFRDVENGKVVLSIGTGSYNDYYPYFVAEFIPRNMSINE